MSGVAYTRTPYLVVHRERQVRKDIYGSIDDMIVLQGQIMRGERPWRTALVVMHPVGSPAYLPIFARMARAGHHILACASRYWNGDASLQMENVLLDLAIAASCDIIVAAEDAKLGLPELTVGVMGGARHLARIAPQALVRRMFFTGEHVRAVDFAAAGGTIMLCSRDDLTARATALARRIATFSPTAVRLAKQILNRIEDMDLKSGYAFEQGFTVKMSGHPDSKEALKAFSERRDPVYAPLSAGWRVPA